MTRDELIAALEAATGPDAMLDAEISKLLHAQRYYDMIATSDGTNTVVHRPFYTQSRDAMLPGADRFDWRISGMRPHPGGTVYARWKACATPDAPGESFSGTAATEPLARRIAEIKALLPADK